MVATAIFDSRVFIETTMMSGVDATPMRSPGAPGAFSQRFALGGQGAAMDPTMAATGPPWPQSGATPPGIPMSFNIAVDSTPGAISNLGDPAQDQMPPAVAEVEGLKAQVAAMLAGMQLLNEQVQKLLAKPTQPQAMPAPAPTIQPQQQAGQQDPWLGSWQRYQAGNVATAQPGTTAPPPLRPINPKDVEKA